MILENNPSTFSQTSTIMPNGSSPTPPSSQALQFPPGADQPPPGMIGAPQQLQGGTRPPSAAAQQMLPQQQPKQGPNAFPGSLSDLVTSFENVKQRGAYIHDAALVISDLNAAMMHPHSAAPHV